MMVNEIENNYRVNNEKMTKSNSSEYKKKIIRSTPADNNILDTELVVPLKFLSNFWRSLHFSLINWKIEFDLLWSRNSIISEIS